MQFPTSTFNSKYLDLKVVEALLNAAIPSRKMQQDNLKVQYFFFIFAYIGAGMPVLIRINSGFTFGAMDHYGVLIIFQVKVKPTLDLKVKCRYCLTLRGVRIVSPSGLYSVSFDCTRYWFFVDIIPPNL